MLEPCAVGFSLRAFVGDPVVGSEESPVKVAEPCSQRSDKTRCGGGSTMAHQASLKMRERLMVVLTLMLAAVLVAALFPLPAWGQATAAVNGTVRDSAGRGRHMVSL